MQSLAGVSMFRSDLPRVYELIDLVKDRSDTHSYFYNFENSLVCKKTGLTKKRIWLSRERELQQLDAESWITLKQEALPYLTIKSEKKHRGWQQLISILDQAKAYVYLSTLGCSDIKFIPRDIINKKKTPDLSASLNDRKVICEVKTVNISDNEIGRRLSKGVTSINNFLSEDFMRKLKKIISTAIEQIFSYDDHDTTRKIIFIIISFDDFLDEYKNHYYCQIDKSLVFINNTDVELVFFNSSSIFHSELLMANAQVINEKV